MLCIRLENTDPFFCLAAEEYLLKNFSDDIFLLWQSQNTVVAGKHQNLLAEVDYPFCRENNIILARRISGGGTVFHDAGNVNFSFFKNVAGSHEISFSRFIEPVRLALKEMGADTEISGRNDLLAGGLKISGNAEHVFKNRVLHHGTLLFNSDLQNLGQAIRVTAGKYQSKAVQSNRSPVGNISSFIKEGEGIGNFIRFLLDFQLRSEGNRAYKLTENDTWQVEKLAEEKYSTFSWRFGYSPAYTFKNETLVGGMPVSVELSVKNGLVETGQIAGAGISEAQKSIIAENLKGKKHLYEDIQDVLQETFGNVPESWVYAFF